MARQSEVDLDLTLYVSFALPMYRRIGSCWVKIFGYGAGTAICYGEALRCYGNLCSDDALKYVLGLWLDVERGLQETEGRARAIAEELVERFRCLGISASPWDPLAVLTSAFLSRRTDYHRNTVRWVRALLSRLGGLEAHDIGTIRRVALSLYEEYGSYQLLQYAEVLGQLREVSLSRPANPDEVRRSLLRVKYVGPKVAHSFILHSGLDGTWAPVDVHYERFLRRHSLLGEGRLLPPKALCSRYSCPSCPLSSSCVYAYTREVFGRLNGFVQTAAYVMGKLGIESCEDLGRVRSLVAV